MANRRYSLNNQSNPSSTTSSGNSSKTSSPASPAPASGSTGANSSPSPAPASAPGWMVASAPWAFWGSLIILTSLALRWIPFNWGLMLFFALLGGGASLLLKKSKTISFFRWMSGGIILTTILSAWFFPQLPAAVESYQPGVSSPQEQVASPSPPPTSEAPIARERIAQIPGKVIVLTKSKTINLPPGQKDICFSWLGYNTNGDRVNQQLTIGGVQFSTQGSNCFPVEMEGEVEVKFLNPPQTEVDTYKIIREKGGQGEYPFIKLPK